MCIHFMCVHTCKADNVKIVYTLVHTAHKSLYSIAFTFVEMCVCVCIVYSLHVKW